LDFFKGSKIEENPMFQTFNFKLLSQNLIWSKFKSLWQISNYFQKDNAFKICLIISATDV